MASSAATTPYSFLLHLHHQKHRLPSHCHHLTLTPTPTPTPSHTPFRLKSSVPFPSLPCGHLHLRHRAVAAALEWKDGRFSRDVPDPRTLFVGNIPFTLTSPELKEVFSQAGMVSTVEIIYDRLTGRSRGFAFVTMASPEMAHNAIHMLDHSIVGGRTVTVNYPEVPKGGERAALTTFRARQSGLDGSYRVYVGNLSWLVTSVSLRKAFDGLPGMLSARVIYNRESGRSRGFGFISFASEEDARAAIESMNSFELEGRPIYLCMAQTEPASSNSQ